jgi:hypothetical protein
MNDAGWRSFRAPLFDSAQYVVQGLFWGALSGLIFAGILGRLAMFILRLTSDPALAGTKTDNDFTIGAITTDSLSLLALGSVAGAFGGAIYTFFRGWVPPRFRLTAAGVFAAVGIGTLVIEPHGVDFTVVEPHALALAMFIAIPAGYGVTAAWLIEHAYARGLRIPDAAALVLSLALFVPQGPTAVLPATAAVALMAGNRGGLVSRVWHHSIVTWAGRAALAAVFALATRALIEDVIAVL